MAQWSEIMRERSESGLSIVKYCERERMPTNRYHYWQRRLRTAALKEIMSATETSAAVPAGWRQVSVADNKKGTESGVSIEIGKCRVVAENTTDIELLTKVCKALISL